MEPIDPDILKFVALGLADKLWQTRLTIEDLAAHDFAAELKSIDLEQRLGRLLPADEVARAFDYCREIIVRAIKGVPLYSEEFVAAHARDGVKGVRVVLRRRERAYIDALRTALIAAGDGAEAPDG